MKDYTLNDLVNDYSNYIRTVVKNASSALTEEDREEILEDTIYNVYKKLDKLEKDNLKAYIASSARNLTINKLKSNKKYDTDSLNAMKEDVDFEAVDLSSDTLDIAISNDKMNLIKNIINGFDEIDKKVFMDFYFANKKVSEISKETKLSKTNIKVKLHRSRTTLKNELIKGGYNYD